MESDFLGLLRRKSRILGPRATIVPLTGGVSSEIYLVEDGDRRFVVKRALPKLKVKDDWFADVGRNAIEHDYMACVNRMIPDAVPQLYFSSPDEGYFAMEFLDADFSNWKSLLLAGDFRPGHAKIAARILGHIHERTAFDNALMKQFDTSASFHQLRVEPYLLTTGARNPALQAIFNAEAERIEATHEALVHGDFSPKNILIKGDRMVLLDCEVAWYGDPVFDVAFLLNHLFLKSLYHAPLHCEVENMVSSFWQTYASARSGANILTVQRRLVPLLLMLLLARVDGKSPVEYLNVQKRAFIRSFVHRHLPSPMDRLDELSGAWLGAIAADFGGASA
jgi:aminoglycoside phosphotransferase (APT) family kinase protein